jgi:hypothetical protein
VSPRVEAPETREPWRPAEAADTTGSPGDVAAVMLACIMQSRGAQETTARANIEQSYELLERAREELRRAMERAEEAAEDAGFWGDVSNALGSELASIAGVAAAVSLAVATGGAGAPAVIALTAAGLTVGAKVGQEVGADPRLVAALGVGGGLLGLFAGNAAGASSAWTTAAQVSTAVQSGTATAGGGASIVEGQHRADELDARADARVAEGRQDDAWLRLDLAIAEIERACRDVARAQASASRVLETENEGTRAIISRIGAA